MYEEILQIISNYNPWNEQGQSLGIRRDTYLAALVGLIGCPEIITVSGIRRGGKSTILRQLQHEIIKQGANPVSTIFINFEDPRLEEFCTAKNLQQFISEHHKKNSLKATSYFFLDEIERVEQWERVLNSFYEQQEKIKFFISGSNSKIFNTEISSVLSGRYINKEIYTLSYREYLSFIENAQASSDAIIDYLNWGGFPRVTLEKDPALKMEILKSYLDTIIEKDLIIRHKIRKHQELKALLKYVVSNPARLISSYNLEKVLKINNTTIAKYLSYMEGAYLIKRLACYSSSVKQQIYRPDKVIIADTGLHKIAGFSAGNQLGNLLENTIGNALAKKYPRDLYYWKNSTEVDFVYLDQVNKNINFCNVAVSVDEEDTYIREINSLKVAREHFGEFPNMQEQLLILFDNLNRKDKKIQKVIDFLD